MKKIITLVGIVGLVAMATALATMEKVFDDTYNIKKDSKLKAAACSVCHTSKKGGKLNPYGNDVKGAMGSAKKLTSAMLKSVESKDSDGDGTNNKAEIDADRNPGVKN